MPTHVSEETAESISICHGRYLGMVDLIERGDLRLHVSTFESYKRALVAHLVAVVWCRENREALTTLLVFVALVLHLMRAHN